MQSGGVASPVSPPEAKQELAASFHPCIPPTSATNVPQTKFGKNQGIPQGVAALLLCSKGGEDEWQCHSLKHLPLSSERGAFQHLWEWWAGHSIASCTSLT